MFKKLKDKLAEEVKSSPQRIQQFAQAAQAAVTSASSSITDISNSDLFSIGDNDNQQPRPVKTQTSNQQNTFQDVTLVQPAVSPESVDHTSSHEIVENQRLRRLSNSSFASDVSFRLPSYESPSTMYHLQSDMEVSASEAEERGFSSGAVSLDRVTKEQLYGAYRRTQDRYTKYRTQYGDLARHYKLLERENAKARSVLVETQDKALRRISELREQCALEQSAKAHLEKALRVEIEERNMKIDSLNTKIKLLQYEPQTTDKSNMVKKNPDVNNTENENEIQLINLSNDEQSKHLNDEAVEISVLTNKLEKMEQLLNKYKESLKMSKEKNSQITAELQMLVSEIDNKNKENEQLKVTVKQLDDAKQKILELNSLNEELQNKINTYDFSKTRQLSTLEIDLQKAQEEIVQLQSKIDISSKREEEYAISLAENKLSIHKELESKEAEIRSLKDTLSATKNEIQSLNIVIEDYKNNISALEEDRSKYNNDSQENNQIKIKNSEMETQIQDLAKKTHMLEQMKTKADEEYKCLQLQFKQETAEKLAMIDRNVYLVNKNTHLSDDNTKKGTQISKLESEIQELKVSESTLARYEADKSQLVEELNKWKSKYQTEIQDEREELIKLQSEIEKLLSNHELIQKQNTEYIETISLLKTEKAALQEKINKFINMQALCKDLRNKITTLKQMLYLTSEETKSFKEISGNMITTLMEKLNNSLNHLIKHETEASHGELKEVELRYTTLQTELQKTREQLTATSKGLNSLQEHNNHLSTTVDALLSEKELLNQQIINLNNKYDTACTDLHSLNEENLSMKSIILKLEKSYKDLEATIIQERTQYSELTDQLAVLQTEKQDLSNKLQSFDNETASLQTELYTLKLKHKEVVLDLDNLQKENKDNLDKSKYFDDKLLYITKLEENIGHLTNENISLKEQAESITESVKHLETEIHEVRKSHSEIESEKDHLSELIEELEKKEQEKKLMLDDTNTQTDPIIVATVETNTTEEIEPQLKEELLTVQLCNASNDVSLVMTEKYKSLQSEYDALREENRRLQSDIEGLQSYLTKISKENSTLNDKLREMIATGEHIPEMGSEIKSEIQASKDKINDLLRENSLLIEENLELKDQLQSQAYATKNLETDEWENKELGEQYNNLLQENSKLELRLVDLEQMTNSTSGNLQQMQDKNEKLKSTNEKLEQRLDEALVSLRHLHALQENTELEYLRNILYEYLTGSGTHSITLAKVLAAIVKFDDTQTQQVLQKEKERQGILHQLGII